ncbi:MULTISPECIES: Crp/Fnr family transcriptional regulator [Mammaliicoccus]|uniref:HTH-type transcriptional regulator ArcR n=2 Tax=Mammaliicoccus lentus TaxID=42858 RepID=A0AAP1RSC3_MAMLE|nr:MULTISPECIES: Crp/Fnr family transcriptional regulator [Mammaliicoccus]HBV04541.1 Crp/Fnr family transcriptional regulator [Staphylococcus sp.]MBF0748929.1 Crp/Fnr family transcriptional regulator [Mammaliicoccus lentus]MBF0841803.1 Crp/Fnr family transcriptional regulator [Mammaliicoccus lentus]MBU6112924.1 Crp/Fnr family transcriptional regulator [Mammaliicoccus lentus]MBW0762488.1 Crp/Fnr family transcriptional regulator [Mammaliicoccus lentus]
MQTTYTEATSVIEYIISHGQRMHFNAHNYIYHSGDLSNHIYVVIEGKVILHRIMEDGKEFNTKLIGPRSIFGSTTLFCGRKTHTLSAKTKENATIIKLPKKDFEEAILNDEVLKYEWLLWVQNENEKHEYQIRDIYTLGKTGGFYSVLIKLANTYGVADEEGILINVELTNHELANFCNVTRESVNRMLSHLKKENIVSVKHKTIIIKDLNYLKNAINCDNCPLSICRIE